MRRIATVLATGGLLAIGALGLALPAAGHGSGTSADGDQQDQHMGGQHMAGGHMGEGQMPQNLDEMREMHRGHEHGHDFEAMEEMSPEKRDRIIALMRGIGLRMPPMRRR